LSLGERFDQSVLQTAPFRFAVLWALWFASFFFFDGESQNGTTHSLITWAGIYLLGSTSVLLFIETFHQAYHERDPRKFVETSAWFFLSASCLALGFFTGLYPMWAPLAIGGALCGVRTLRGVND
jgi:hypothetical protein